MLLGQQMSFPTCCEWSDWHGHLNRLMAMMNTNNRQWGRTLKYPFYFLEYNKITKSFDYPEDDTFKDLYNKFYVEFKNLWFIDNKPQGFEIHDARIGGLIQRAKHCRKRIIEYANSEIENIPELEEKVLDYLDNGGSERKEQTMMMVYRNIISRG